MRVEVAKVPAVVPDVQDGPEELVRRAGTNTRYFPEPSM